jgi:glycyl-tRNA synthetase beta chain
MPQLLLELFSEEIPARMQKRAEEDLARAFGEKLKAHGLEAKAMATFSSPRRLGLTIDDLPAKAADVNEEKKGPRVGAPDQALQGFLKSAGLTSIDQAQVVEDKKGAFYVAKIERAGRETGAILQEIVPEVIRAFPWPKSMRSGVSDLQWVRPLQNILCLFDGKPVKISVDTVPSEATTWGHRFHAPTPIAVTSVSQYKQALAGAHVVIEREERKRVILEGAKAACAKAGLELVEDAGLLEEVAGLAEWPVVLMGDMDPSFLNLPGEVIRLSMRTHQKYFAVRDPKTKGLAPHFITVANVSAKDGGKAIAAGNARVLSARLSDAQFFWKVDTATPLFTEERKAKLQKIVFHQKLGSVWDKVERVKALAEELCAVTGADKKLVAEAAYLCKMDLVTETVGEFPELQGQVGRQLYLASPSMGEAPRSGGGGARAGVESTASRGSSAKTGGPHPLSHATRDSSPIEGERESIAAAIEDHYRPLGPNDRVPSDPVAVTLALADKLDTLVGFWAIDEKPTGSSDPFALRRAALGIIRLVLENGLRLPLVNKVWLATAGIPSCEPMALEEVDRLYATLDSAGVTITGEEFGSKVSSEASARIQLWFLMLRAEWASAKLLGPNSTDDLSAFLYLCESRIPSLRQKLFRSFGDSELGKRDREDWQRAVDRAIEQLSLRTEEWRASLLAFLADRLKVQLRDQGKRHDLVDAVFALGDDDLVRIVARVEALDAFLKTEDGANLLAGYKRAANILAAEEKKGKGLSEADLKAGLDASKLAEPAEKALYDALEKALPAARAAVEKEEFAHAMKALSGLRAPVDAFFDKVLVNAPEERLRRNRLLLLQRFREALSQVADFSKIEG